jgi:hypothetical protein
MPPGVPQIEVRPPTLFTPKAIVVTILYGFILLIPVLFSIVFVSVLQFGAITFLVPMITISVATFFLPLGFGNPYVVRLFRQVRPISEDPQDCHLVQLKRVPRSRSGLLGILEDADDLGFLNLCDSALIFEGDSVRLTVPYNHIQDLRLQNAGWRALFAYGAQTSFKVAGLPQEGRFIFAERSSSLLHTSRKNARCIYQRLLRRIQASTEHEAV